MDGGATIFLKLGAFVAATTAGGAVVAEVITGTERLFLGIPQSWFLAAVVGALIGLLLLSEIDAGKVSPPRDGTFTSRWLTLLLRVGLLGLFVLGFALAAGWIVVALSTYFPSMRAAGMAFSGLSGFVIKPMLPHYLAALQKATGGIAGRAGGAS
ncbi:hypothetical protein [Xanthomonas maliensis]|uniref:hypothetical protein n=1 Tax=Xanthomonas maliensis TaxID=1321368 RepID=UPI0003A5F857|nr:hypothetical protein [Xanthomonas maliensis]KAB7767621.1 hypothetical protein CKY51_11170 [Xanthomonas maliensis]